MYNFVYKLYFCFREIVERKKEKKKLNKFLLKIYNFINILFYVYMNYIVKYYYILFPSKCSGIANNEGDDKVIVSLTTHPSRINDVWIAIETILRQTKKPDKVILWLADSQFSDKNSLPIRLLEQEKRGLTIHFCDDLRSHKKYYYTMLNYPDYSVITLDDDFFYPYDIVQKLLELHHMYPKDIVCLSACNISPSFDTVPSQWKSSLFEEYINSSTAQAFGGAGALYPPMSLPKEAFVKDDIFNYCLYADDLWLKMMSYINGIKVTKHKRFHPFPIVIKNSQNTALVQINVNESKNDEQWMELVNRYYTISSSDQILD